MEGTGDPFQYIVFHVWFDIRTSLVQPCVVVRIHNISILPEAARPDGLLALPRLTPSPRLVAPRKTTEHSHTLLCAASIGALLRMIGAGLQKVGGSRMGAEGSAHPRL